MGRRATPWKRKDSGGAWYATVRGRQVKLAESDATKTEATTALIRLLANGSQPATGPPALSMLAVLDLFTADREAKVRRDEMSPRTTEKYAEVFDRLPDELLALPATAIRPHHVTGWLDGIPTWGASLRSTATAIVKAATRWAWKAGHLDSDPLATLSNARVRRREVDAPAGVRDRLLAACKTQPIRDFIVALVDTGCRPGEVASVTAADFSPEAGTWRLAKHKTGRKTGRDRVIYLTPRLVEMSKGLAARNPSGPMFRNLRGNPWNKVAWDHQFARLRARAGIEEAVTAHTMRAAFVGDALTAGVDPSTVATLIGHAGSRLVMEVYSRLQGRTDHLRTALEAIRPADSAAASPTPTPGLPDGRPPGEANPEPAPAPAPAPGRPRGRRPRRPAR